MRLTWDEYCWQRTDSENQSLATSVFCDLSVTERSLSSICRTTGRCQTPRYAGVS